VLTSLTDFEFKIIAVIKDARAKIPTIPDMTATILPIE